jgi:hypothetical protein
VILSASNGDDLAAWLTAEGYAMPEGFAELLGQYQTEGEYFFVSRLSADADPAVPIDPVRFVLPGMDPPTYPLRLTGLGVPPGQTFDLTVWVVAPPSGRWVPSSHPWGTLSPGVTTMAEWNADVEQIFTSSPDGAFAVVAGADAQNDWWISQYSQAEWYPMVQTTCPQSYDMPSEFDPATVGLQPPAAWADEILEIKQGGYAVFRYWGRISSTGMASDLTLVPASTWELPYQANVFGTNEGNCYECPTCPSGSGGYGPWYEGDDVVVEDDPLGCYAMSPKSSHGCSSGARNVRSLGIYALLAPLAFCAVLRRARRRR